MRIRGTIFVTIFVLVPLMLVTWVGASRPTHHLRHLVLPDTTVTTVRKGALDTLIYREMYCRRDLEDRNNDYEALWSEYKSLLERR